MYRLEVANIIIAAKQFNPSVFSDLWLFRNKIASLDELEVAENKIFTDEVAQVSVADFRLLVVPLLFNFTINNLEKAEEVINDRLIPIVSTIPHTPITGVGFQFVLYLELVRHRRHWPGDNQAGVRVTDTQRRWSAGKTKG